MGKFKTLLLACAPALFAACATPSAPVADLAPVQRITDSIPGEKLVREPKLQVAAKPKQARAVKPAKQPKTAGEARDVATADGATPSASVSAGETRADSLFQRGYYQMAASAYTQQLKSNPDNYAALYGQAESLRRSGDVRAALAGYQKLLAQPEWKVRALTGLGYAALLNGDRDGARTTFENATGEDPTAWAAWVGLAQIHDLEREWDKSDQAYAAALKSAARPGLVLNNQGVSALARGKPQWAAELFQAAIEVEPTLAQARTNLDLARGAAGEKPDAQLTAGDAREQARRLNNYGYAAQMQGNDEQARKYYEAAVKEHPSFYAQAYKNLEALPAAQTVVAAPAELAPPVETPKAKKKSRRK